MRFAHRTDESSSTHFPFAAFKILRIELIIALLLDSVSPFAWGYRGVEVISLIFLSLQNCRVVTLMNCEPLSHTISDGIPNRHMILVWMKAYLFYLGFGKKWLLLTGAGGNLPIMSMPHRMKGHGINVVCNGLDGLCVEPECRWQASPFCTYLDASSLNVGQ